MAEYIHASDGAEIILTAEIFKVISEGYLPYGNRELLYIECATTAGSICCGVAELRIIHVPGFVVSRHYRIDVPSGNPVSQVEPIRDDCARKEVKRLLSRSFPSYLFVLS